MTATPTRVTIAEALDILGWTAHRLAVKAGLHTGTVMRALIPGGTVKTNVTSAEAIARALGLYMEDIYWVNGLTHQGRPAETGTPLRVAERQHCTDDVCPVHHLALPATKVCDLCG